MGRDRKNENREEHWTKMIRPTMETPAWKALPIASQALYPWLRLEWRGQKHNNNGKLQLSVKQAAQRMGCNPKTAAGAFHGLQAKGFIVQTHAAILGTGGAAKSPCYEITELALPGQLTGRRLFNDWQEGGDFPVKVSRANNPTGRNGKTKPQPKKRHDPIPIFGTK